MMKYFCMMVAECALNCGMILNYDMNTPLPLQLKPRESLHKTSCLLVHWWSRIVLSNLECYFVVELKQKVCICVVYSSGN